MSSIFGTDGVRGKANVAPMDSETVMRLGRAAAQVFRRSEGRHRILIGKDTRVSGYMLETALASGFASMGVDVLLVGPLPTPGIAFMTRSMRLDAGVVISASHNPYEDNGIKFFGPDGFKLPDETEKEMERLMEPGHLDELRADPDLVGKAYRIDDAVGRYTVYLKSCVERECKFDQLKVVIDAANGAGYKVGPMVFSELGADVIEIGCRPDGRNINEGCGSLHPESLIQSVKQNSAHLGIALDGDADRVLLIDECGEMLDGDTILATLAFDWAQRGLLRGGCVVGTVMSNLSLQLALEEKGLKLHRSKVGDRYVLSDMLELNANLGGEQSGHVIALDHNTTGDGLLTALLVVSTALRQQKPLSHFTRLLKRCPQVLLNIKVTEKKPFSEVPGLEKAMAEAERILGQRGRLLVRYSGTENIARVMVEADDEQVCSRCSEMVAETFR